MYAYLKLNTYPGRGIALGQTKDGDALLAYFIMGRSQNSRNRVFEKTEDGIRILPYDAALVEDPSLIIYHPMRTHRGRIILTNGDQTDTIYQGFQKNLTFEQALNQRAYEPDAPNFTPRISGLLAWQDGEIRYRLSILKKQRGTGCARQYFHYQGEPGVMHLIHTYMGDGQPLPPFEGEPKAFDVQDAPQDFAARLWDSLNADNRIALYVQCQKKTGEKLDFMFSRFQ